MRNTSQRCLHADYISYPTRPPLRAWSTLHPSSRNARGALPELTTVLATLDVLLTRLPIGPEYQE